MKFDKHFIVTFERKMRVGRESQWVEGSRIFEDMETARDFMATMYSINEGGFRHVHLWSGVEVEHRVEAKVIFDEDSDW